METFDHIERAFRGARRVMDEMCEEEAALLRLSDVETAIAAFRRGEITAEQRCALLRILQPDGRIIIVETVPHDDES